VSWSVVEHTADVGLEAEGEDLAEALEQVIAGFGHLVCPEAEVEPARERELTVEAPGLDHLVVDLLDELNYVHQIDRFLPAEADVSLDRAGEDPRVRALVRGETYDRERHGHLMEITATTYHELAVDAGDGRVWVLFDV
jgi:SHS2 domain-containing protein